jgi:hypothetical protein
VGIRDFIRHLKEHQEKLKKGPGLSDAEPMVGMADAAITELESVIGNRRVNLPEEHAVRFAQDVFLYLREEEEKVKRWLREPDSRDAAGP